MSVIKFTKKVVVKPEMVEYLLISAFEGGSNYWYDDLETLDKTSTKSTASERFYEDIVTHGFSLVDKENNNTKHSVTPEMLKAAVKVMHDTELSHFNDAMNENDDASTGDVYLQLAVFGKVIYG